MPSLFDATYNPDVLSCIANLSNDEVFTPPELANQMLDMLPEELWSDPSATFLDPACKSGVFLREIAKRLIAGLEDEFPDLQERLDHIYKNQLFGIAITELTSLLARRSLYCSKYPNSKYSVVEFENAEGNVRYRTIEHDWYAGRCRKCGASQKEYERDEALEQHAYEFIHLDNPEEVLNMKFDVIIGNPPYQLSDGGFSISATPIYHLFVETAKKLSPRYITMIIPARWYAGGKGLDSFRESMLYDNRLTELHDYPDATEIFPSVQLKGGACYFLWTRDAKGLCKVINHQSTFKNSVEKRPLIEPGSDVFIRWNQAVKIFRKVKQQNEKPLAALVSSRKPFGLDTLFHGKSKGEIHLFENGGESYTDKKNLIKGTNLLNSWKVFIPRAGSGSDAFPHSILGIPFVGEPASACTETYLAIGPLQNRNEAKNLISYIATKFFRFMVLLHKPTQDASNKVYSFVPMQDFSKPWTDEELYKKYGITEEEQAFIDSLIRPMDLGDSDA